MSKETTRISVGMAPATFGELLQGRNEKGDDFLVTMPIHSWTKAIFTKLRRNDRLYIVPSHKVKSLKAMKLYLDHYQLKNGGLLVLDSSLAEGKGFASSSSDVVATIRAMDKCFGKKSGTILINNFLRQIEPSDAVMYNDSVYFNHIKCKTLDVFGRLPPFVILGVDEGGAIDTVRYNNKPIRFTELERNKYQGLIENLKKAIKVRSVKNIGTVATESACLYQKRNPKKLLGEFLKLKDECKADGVINSHSGTVIGLCFDALDPNLLEKLSFSRQLILRKYNIEPFKAYSLQ